MKITYDPKTKKVLAIIQASPAPLAMPDITYYAQALDEYGDMEVRQIVWRLVSHNAVEQTNDSKFQPQGGRTEGSSKWASVQSERSKVEAAQSELKSVLSEMVSN